MKIFSRLKGHPFRAAALFFLIFVAVGFSCLSILFCGPRPECGIAIDVAFGRYASEHGGTKEFPNVNGSGDASLKLIEHFSDARLFRYGYVPGLRSDDSTDFVMLYLRTKTRYTCHGDGNHNIFSPKLWKVMSPRLDSCGPDPEGGQLVTTAEFKRRMQATLAFLKENQRPNWQAVVAEQTAFLNSIKE